MRNTETNYSDNIENQLLFVFGIPNKTITLIFNNFSEFIKIVLDLFKSIVEDNMNNKPVLMTVLNMLISNKLNEVNLEFSKLDSEYKRNKVMSNETIKPVETAAGVRIDQILDKQNCYIQKNGTE